MLRTREEQVKELQRRTRSGVFTDSTERSKSSDKSLSDVEVDDAVEGEVDAFNNDGAEEVGIFLFEDSGIDKDINDEFTLEELEDASEVLADQFSLDESEVSDSFQILPKKLGTNNSNSLSETEVSKQISILLHEMSPPKPIVHGVFDLESNQDPLFHKRQYEGAMIGGKPDESSEDNTHPVKISSAVKGHKSDGELLHGKHKSNVEKIKKSQSLLMIADDEANTQTKHDNKPHLVRRVSEFFNSHKDHDKEERREEISTSPTRPTLTRRISEFFKPHKNSNDDSEISPKFSRKRANSKGAGDAQESNSPPKASPEFGRKKRGNSAGAKDSVKPLHNKETSPGLIRKKKSRKSDGAKNTPESVSPPRISPVFSRKKEDAKAVKDAAENSSPPKTSPGLARKHISSREKRDVQLDYNSLLSIIQNAEPDVLKVAARSSKFSEAAAELLYYIDVEDHNLRKLLYTCGMTKDMSDVLLYAGGCISHPPFDLNVKPHTQMYIQKLHTALRYGMNAIHVSIDGEVIQYGEPYHERRLAYKFDPEKIEERVIAARYIAAFNLMDSMSVYDILRCVDERRIVIDCDYVKGRENINAMIHIMEQQLRECPGIMYLLARSIAYSRGGSVRGFIESCAAHNLQAMIDLPNTPNSDWHDLERFSDIFAPCIKGSERVVLQSTIDSIERYRSML